MPVNPWLYITPAKNIAALVPPNAIFFMDKNGKESSFLIKKN
jgi:hypothetical protein